MTRKKQTIVLTGLGVIAAGFAIAQGPRPMAVPNRPSSGPPPTAKAIGPNVINFGTNVGSFKVLPFNDEAPTRGTLSFSFNGSVLVSGLKGTLTTTGSVREEYKNDKYEKRLFFGKGSMTLTGSVRSVQFFGRDVKGSLRGNGLITFYGEFDKNLDTGYWEYPGGDRGVWGTGGMQKSVPQIVYGAVGNEIKIEKSK